MLFLYESLGGAVDGAATGEMKNERGTAIKNSMLQYPGLLQLPAVQIARLYAPTAVEVGLSV